MSFQGIIINCFAGQVRDQMTGSSSGQITRKGIPDSVQDLLVVPHGHILALPRKKWRHFTMELEEDDRKSWKHLGQELQIDKDDLREFQVSLQFQ